MSQEETQSSSRSTAKPGHAPIALMLLMTPVNWCLALLGMIIGSLFLSIMIEWVGMSVPALWKDEGSLHSYRILQQEIGYLNRDFRDRMMGISPYEFAQSVAIQAHATLFVKTGLQETIDALDIENYSSKIGQDRLEKGNDLFGQAVDKITTSNFLQTAYALFGDYLKAAMIVTELVSVRVAIALLSLPAFLFIALVAVVDGLVERDLRRFGGGMERAMLYHYVKPHARMIVVLAWVIYLSAPIGMHPNVIFVPAALLFGWVVFTTVSSFKKFL